MIFGIGTDIARIVRFQRILATYGDRFVRKVCHPEELATYQALTDTARKSQFVASRYVRLLGIERQVHVPCRWAVKEATLKAIGPRIFFPDVLVRSGDKTGKFAVSNISVR